MLKGGQTHSKCRSVKVPVGKINNSGVIQMPLNLSLHWDIINDFPGIYGLVTSMLHLHYFVSCLLWFSTFAFLRLLLHKSAVFIFTQTLVTLPVMSDNYQQAKKNMSSIVVMFSFVLSLACLVHLPSKCFIHQLSRMMNYVFSSGRLKEL